MRKISQNKKSGFTLIELMIVVAILGILAAVAIPAFATYVRRSKTSEVYGNLEGMFKALSAYYNKDFQQPGGISATSLAHCGIAQQNTMSGAGDAAAQDPTDVKQLQNPATLVDGQPYAENSGIGFNAGSSYYVYGNNAFADGCSGGGNLDAYVLNAYGDLDNDGTNSQFSLATATNASNEIYKAGQTFIVNELE